jgi:hypothetical protein
MRIYVLRFDNRDAVSRAFGVVMDSGAVESASVGPDPGQLRFIAKAADAEPVIRRIYLLRELRWCSTHRVLTSRPGELG